MKQQTVKLRAGDFLVRSIMEQDDTHIYLQTPFNRTLIDEIKTFQGVKWHGYDEENPRKVWSFPINTRNLFQFEYLCGGNPYARYEKALMPVTSFRPFFKHQYLFKAVVKTYRQVIIAGEMGTGKTLPIAEVVEESGFRDWFWVAPRSALNGVKLDFDKWHIGIRPRFMTYEELKKWTQEWESGDPIPHGVVFDESSKLKNHTSQRTQAAIMLVDAMRDAYGYDGCYIVLASGSPAPKSPVDWWSQCEITCPGFIKEGDVYKFKRRLAVIVDKESEAGGVYPELVAWLDDDRRCSVCGQLKDHENHDFKNSGYDWYHEFKQAKNEVQYLYERMKGLVTVVFKKDCLDLPEKEYRIIRCPPTPEMLRASQLIAARSTRAIQALTLLRELSDGFQYIEEKVGEETCHACKGAKIVEDYAAETDAPISQEDIDAGRVRKIQIPCIVCDGTGLVPKLQQTTQKVETPKDEALSGLLDECEDVGRIVVFASFEASVDRVTELCLKEKWNVIRVDGRGWHFYTPSGELDMSDMDMLKAFQFGDSTHDKIAFVGHPESGGTGLTLTKAFMLVYYSNDFKAENRIQSEDRIHRPGMDVNRGAIIVDLFHLPTDEYVYNNLKKKRDLQAMSMGDLRDALKGAT